jgi:type I restriction enzyme S subunit
MGDYIQSVIQLFRDGMGVPHLFQKDIRKFQILVPPLSEQGEIAAFLDCEIAKIDALISKNEETIIRLQEYRIALISAAVTGKIDVRGEV